MGVFKKYPAFAGLVTGFILLFVVGVVFIYLASSKASKAKKDYDRADSSYRSALSLTPAPTPQNIAASEVNLANLRLALEKQIEATRGRAPFIISKDAPTTEAAMLFQLEAFKEQFTKDAANITSDTEAGESTSIILPEDFDFGFSRFLASGKPPPIEFIPVVFEQKEILAYILRKLYETEPYSIEEIQREVKVVKIENNKNAPKTADNDMMKDEFEVGSVSARKEGAIETLAFRIVFTGYTPSLRLFLKQLEEFELPLVVRSVEVKPFKEAASKVASSSTNDDNPFAIFGIVEEEEGPTQEQLEAAVVPVIEENLSQFTVVVESIKVLVGAPTDVTALETNADSTPPM